VLPTFICHTKVLIVQKHIQTRLLLLYDLLFK